MLLAVAYHNSAPGCAGRSCACDLAGSVVVRSFLCLGGGAFKLVLARNEDSMSGGNGDEAAAVALAVVMAWCWWWRLFYVVGRRRTFRARDGSVIDVVGGGVPQLSAGLRGPLLCALLGGVVTSSYLAWMACCVQVGTCRR